MTKKIVSIILIIMAFTLFYTCIVLDSWNNKYLAPCCNMICGRTISFEECLPNYIVAWLIIFGIILILLAIFNMVDNDNV